MRTAEKEILKLTQTALENLKEQNLYGCFEYHWKRRQREIEFGTYKEKKDDSK